MLKKLTMLALAAIAIVGPQPAYAGHGHAGPAGPQGPVGATGAVGAQGPIGVPGMIGATGPAGANGQDTSTETKVLLSGDVRIWDLKHASLYFFDNYNWFDRHNDSFGVRVGFKLGKSYEETRLEQLEAAFVTSLTVAGALMEKRDKQIAQQDAEIGELKMAIRKMQDESIISTKKDARLRSFNQLNKDGSLR